MESTSATTDGNLGKLLRQDVPAESGALIDLLPPRRAWTCGELDAAADAFADALTREGLHPDARVAILGENCAEHLIAYMGIMRAGAGAMQRATEIPVDIIGIVQGMILLFVAAQVVIDHALPRWRASRI